MDPRLIHPDSTVGASFSPEQDPSAHEQALAGGVDPSDVSGGLAQTEPKPKPKPRKSERDVGKTLLPVARVQKILKADKEMSTCGKDAVFLISVAAEEFIKRLAQAGHQQAQRDKRSTVQQRDLATAVRTTQHEELAFLEDIIPPAISLSRALELASQVDPNDLFAEPPPKTTSRPPEGRKRDKGKEIEPEVHREKQNGTDKEGEKNKRRKSSTQPNGVAAGKARASDPSTNSHSRPPANGTRRRASSPRPSRSQSHQHHAPFNPTHQAQHPHEPRSHTQPHTHHHHHHHHHSPVQSHDYPPPPGHSVATNGAPFGYPHPGLSHPNHHYPPPSEMNHVPEPHHSPREPRYSPHSPRDHFYPPPPDMQYHHPLPPLPAHYSEYHHAPPNHFDPRGPPAPYGPYWHGPGPEGYERPGPAGSEYVDPRDRSYGEGQEPYYPPPPPRHPREHDPREDHYLRMDDRR